MVGWVGGFELRLDTPKVPSRGQYAAPLVRYSLKCPLEGTLGVCRNMYNQPSKLINIPYQILF